MEEEDEIEYEIFFNETDIRQTLRKQDDNLFKDIISTSKTVFNENVMMHGTVGAQALNKFMIEDWAPKAEEEETLKTSKTKKRIMSFENSNKDENSDAEQDDANKEAQPILDIDNSQTMVK